MHPTTKKLGTIAVTSASLLALGVVLAPRISAMLGTSSNGDGPALEGGIVPIGNVMRAEWVQVPGCGCPEVNGGPELAYRMLSAPDAVPVVLAYAWVSPEGFPTTIAATTTTALPTVLESRDVDLGIACAPSYVVYASDRAVTIFDRRTGGILATGPGNDEVAQSPRVEGPIAMRCARAAATAGKLRWTDDEGLPHEVPLPQPPR